MTAVFFALGLFSASWAARIPAVKGALHLSAGQLGLALLGPAVGCVAAMPAVGAALTCVPPRRMMAIGLVPFAGALPLVAVVDATWQLFAVLLVWGVGLGIVDVAMNTEAAAVQDRSGRRLMSGFHAAYSVGGLSGAGIGALAAATSVSVGWHLGVGGAVVLAGGWIAIGVLPRHAPAPGDSLPHSAPAAGHRHMPKLTWSLVALAAVAFGCFLAEGAANDWSAVYLHTSLGSSAGLAALGYTVFATAMAIGRLSGDRLAHRLGVVTLVRLSTLVAAGGFGAALLIGRPAAGLVGFAVLGIGLSVAVPLVFTSASRLGASAGPSLALVTSAGYVGLMAGPPIIGFLADLVGLAGALATVVVVAVVAAILAPTLDRGTPPGPVEPRMAPGERVL